MFKSEEKVIFEMKSGFSIVGLDHFNLDDKCLLVTDLGNIYISKVDYLEEKNTEYLFFNRNKSEISLKASIQSDSVNIVERKIPFELITESTSSELSLSLIIIFDEDEFVKIIEKLKVGLFELASNTDETTMIHNTIVKINENTSIKKCEVFNEKLIIRGLFNTEKKPDLSLFFSDIESYESDDHRIVLNGYFFNYNEELFFKIELYVDNYLKNSLSNRINKSNFTRFSFTIDNESIFIAKVNGNISNENIKDKSVFVIFKDNYLYISDKLSKELIYKNTIKNISKIYISNEIFILSDENSLFRLSLKQSNDITDVFSKISNISSTRICFTDKFNPFFLEIDSEKIVFKNSDKKTVHSIKNSDIVDLIISEKNNMYDRYSNLSTYVELEIIYKDNKISFYVKRDLAKYIFENVFGSYQDNLIDRISFNEVYDNWIKSVSDIVIFNFFGHIYNIEFEYLRNRDFENLNEVLRQTNKLYRVLHEELTVLDLVCVNTYEMLYNNEIEYFKSKSIKADSTHFKNLDNYFCDLKTKLKSDIKGVIETLDNVSYIFIPEDRIDLFVRKLKIEEKYQIEFFSNLAFEKLYNIIYDMLPYYVSNTIGEIIDVYEGIYDYYKHIDSDEVIKELADRIKFMYTYKHFTINSSINITRKEIIEDLYSLIKFNHMKLESEIFFSGGFR